MLIASGKSFMLNSFKSQFFSGLNPFFDEATNGLFFSSLAKIFSTKTYIFFGSIVFRFGSYSLALLVQAGLVKPIRTAASTQYIASATWLNVSPIPAILVQWQVLIFPVFSSIIQSLWNGSFIDSDFLRSSLMIQYLLSER